MNPEGNRQHESFNGRARPLDNRYTPAYTGIPQAGMPSIDNYIMQISQMMFPPYPYYGYHCPNNSFLGSMGTWRDSTLPPLVIPPQMNSYRNFYNPQTMRVNTRETREKFEAKVINLQSDEEEPKQQNVPVSPSNNAIKQTQKQTLVINLEDNSEDKNQNKPEPPLPPKIDIPVKTPKPDPLLQKIPSSETKRKEKELIFQAKTKLISKIKPKQPKIPKPIIKEIREEKVQRQKKKKTLEAERLTLKPEKQKDPEKADKKKADKFQRFQKLQRNQRSDKYDKSEKNRKPVVTDQKTKPEEVHTKEIAKYMESHGEIRHGKEFQSDIPAVKICNGIWFNRWLQEKRKNVLKRQIGALTY